MEWRIDEVPRDPYPHYRALRELGAAVWLPRNGLYALGRFDDVRAALRNPRLFSSAQGVAANDAVSATGAACSSRISAS